MCRFVYALCVYLHVGRFSAQGGGTSLRALGERPRRVVLDTRCGCRCCTLRQWDTWRGDRGGGGLA
jgi:hypothetical protein